MGSAGLSQGFTVPYSRGMAVGDHPSCAGVVIALPCFLVHLGGLSIAYTAHMETQWPRSCCPIVPGPERGEATCGCTLPRVAGRHRTLPVPGPAAACGDNLHHPRHAPGTIPVCGCRGLLQQPGEREPGLWHKGAPSVSGRPRGIKESRGTPFWSPSPQPRPPSDPGGVHLLASTTPESNLQSSPQFLCPHCPPFPSSSMWTRKQVRGRSITATAWSGQRPTVPTSLLLCPRLPPSRLSTYSRGNQVGYRLGSLDMNEVVCAKAWTNFS